MIKKKKGYLWNKDKFFAEEQTEAEQTKPEAEIIEKKYKYVILGTGIPSLIAIDQIREKDKENEVKNISISTILGIVHSYFGIFNFFLGEDFGYWINRTSSTFEKIID